MKYFCNEIINNSLMKASKIYFSALFILSVLSVSCNKNNKEIDYGVSITAPKMIGTSAELFSEENISTLGKSNTLNFLILNNSFASSDSIYNLSFSNNLSPSYKVLSCNKKQNGIVLFKGGDG